MATFFFHQTEHTITYCETHIQGVPKVDKQKRAQNKYITIETYTNICICVKWLIYMSIVGVSV